mgnify:CR=1 FL=1
MRYKILKYDFIGSFHWKFIQDDINNKGIAYEIFKNEFQFDISVR